MAQPAMQPGQRWRGTWDDRTYRFDLLLQVTTAGESDLEGTTEWTLRAGPDLEDKYGEKAVERWKGTRDKDKVALQGNSLDDPHDFCALGEYDLVIQDGRLEGAIEGAPVTLVLDVGMAEPETQPESTADEDDADGGGDDDDDDDDDDDEDDGSGEPELEPEPEPEPEPQPEPEPEPEPDVEAPADQAELARLEMEAEDAMHNSFHASDEDLRYIERFTLEYFKACRNSDPPITPHESVVDWIACCRLGICHITGGDPFSLLDMSRIPDEAAAKSGPNYVASAQLRAVLLAFGPVCSEANIRQIVLRGAVQSPEAAKEAAAMIEANSSIVQWDLSYNSSIEEVEALAGLLRVIKKSLAVEELNLCRVWPSQPKGLSQEFVQLLADAVRALPRLKHLSFAFKPGTQTGILDDEDDVLSAERAGSALSLLDLGELVGDQKGADDILAPLIDAIADSGSLVSVDLQYCELGIATADLVTRMLQSDAQSDVAQLATISVAHNNMYASGMRRLARALAGNQTLTSLNVAANHGGEEAVAQLCKALETTQVTQLNLSLNNGGIGGTRALQELLQHDRLQELDFSYNGVGLRHAASLINTCTKASSLRELTLTGNGLTDIIHNGVMSLLRTHPNLRILRLSNNQIGTRTAEGIIAEMKNRLQLTYVQIEPGSLAKEEVTVALWKLNFKRCRLAKMPVPPPPEHAKVAAANEHLSEQRARYLYGGWRLKAERRSLLLRFGCVCPKFCTKCTSRCRSSCSRCTKCTRSCVGALASAWSSCSDCFQACRCEKPEWCYNFKCRNVLFLLCRPKQCVIATCKLLTSPLRWCCSSGSSFASDIMTGYSRFKKSLRGLVGLSTEEDGWPLVNGRPVLASFEPGRTYQQACDPNVIYDM